MNSVGTVNPKINAYVPEQLKAKLEQWMVRLNCNQSEAIRHALTTFYEIGDENLEFLMSLSEEKRRSIGDQGAIVLKEALEKLRNGEVND